MDRKHTQKVMRSRCSWRRGFRHASLMVPPCSGLRIEVRAREACAAGTMATTVWEGKHRMPMFESTVSALTEVIIRERCEAAESASSSAFEAVARFLLKTHGLMPDYLRLPLKSLTLLFGLWTVPITGKPFHRLSPERQVAVLRAWKRSALGPRRDLIKFYETLAIFGWYAERYGQDYVHDISASPHVYR
jgi:hypothetical protein